MSPPSDSVSFPTKMFRHVPTPGVYTGATQRMHAWLSNVLAKSDFLGDETTTAYAYTKQDPIGPLKWVGEQVPRKLCGMRFKDFVPAYGRPGAYLAKPDEVVVMSDEFERTFEAEQVIVPIGDINYTNMYTKQVLQECAREWCGGGKGNANLSDENVLIMYYSAIQSLVYEFVKCETIEDLEKLAYPLLALVRALATLHKAIPSAQKILDTMIAVPCLDDMLQKALAYVFAQVPVTLEDQLEMLENIVRRIWRHDEKVKMTSPGLIAVFLAMRLMSLSMSTSSSSPLTHDTAKEFVKAFNKRVVDYSQNLATLPKGDVEVRTILALSKTAFVKALTKPQVVNFLAILKANPLNPVPWVELGVLPPPMALVPSVYSESFGVRGKPSTTLSAVIKVKSPTSFSAVGRKGTDWTGIQFLSSGIYTIDLVLLGTAEFARGDSRGEDLKANLRMTLGADVMTQYEHCYSLAGMEQYRRVSLAGQPGPWAIRDNAPRLNPHRALQVVVTKDNVALVQDRMTFARYPRDDKPVLVAFKNVLLNVTFEEEKVSKTPSAFALLSEMCA